MAKIEDFFDFIESIIGSFYQFRVLDIVDIFLVAIIIYNLLMLIRQTRAVQVSKGIIGILIIYILLKALNLSTITWLLDHVLIYGTLITVIIFQQELRNFLERLGRSSSISGVKNSNAYVAESLADAMINMSTRLVGALIIVEQITKLGDIVQTGTVINAEVSTALVEQIFEPNTPLHDGAVIIEGSKILAAGCLLPLTPEIGVDKALGTRHRAAIGVSEISDALAFAVSEENGIISVAIHGELKRHLTKKEIVSMLVKEDDQTSRTIWDLVLGRRKKNGRRQN